MLTDFITATDCSTCKLCCNFLRSSAWETPALEPELIYLLQEECVPLAQRQDGSTSFYLHYCTSDASELALCPMLSPQSGCTLPRELRPFECRIWPLRMMRTGGRLAIGLYKNCPALTGAKRQALIHYATTELLPAMQAYARSHPKAVRDRNNAYDLIWQET